jgi:hypothetical protein
MPRKVVRMHAALRAMRILADPAAEWAKIASEPGAPVYLLIRYVAPLALIPAVSGLVGGCLVGVIVPGLGHVHVPLLHGLLAASFGYLVSLAAMALLAAIIRLCAPLFAERADFATAFTLAVYSYTPVWLVGVFLLLPGLRFLTLGGFYGGYILFVGLRQLTKLPAQNLRGFAAFIIACAFVLTLFAGAAQRMLFPGSLAL